MKCIVSSCLLGVNCKYNGGNNYHQKLNNFLKGKEIIAICPEVLAGLTIPRNPVEIYNGKFIDEVGNDLDEIYQRGVEKAISIIKEDEIEMAILQSRSPTCGVKQIYDGTFSKKLIEGQGAFAAKLIQEGYKVLDVEDFD